MVWVRPLRLSKLIIKIGTIVVSYWADTLFRPLIDNWSALRSTYNRGLALNKRVIRNITAAAEYPYITRQLRKQTPRIYRPYRRRNPAAGGSGI